MNTPPISYESVLKDLKQVDNWYIGELKEIYETAEGLEIIERMEHLIALTKQKLRAITNPYVRSHHEHTTPSVISGSPQTRGEPTGQ